MSEEHTAHQPLGAFTIFTKCKELVIANLNSYAVLLLVPLALNIIVSLSMKASTANYNGLGFGGLDFGAVGAGAGFGLLSVVVSIFISFFLVALDLEVVKGKKPELAQLWPTVKKYGWRLLGLFLLVGVMVVCGLILLIVPGLIILRRYIMAPFVLIDQDLSISAALEESARLSKPYSGAIWGIIGVSFLCSLAGIIPVIGWIISFILSGLYQPAVAYRYLELKKIVGKA